MVDTTDMPYGAETTPFAGEFETKTFQHDGLTLAYTDWNASGGDPVVLLHGANVQGHTWDPLAHALSPDRRVISMDLRGHGYSDWARNGYFLKYFVADLAALADHLGLGTFDLIGHSLGCRIAFGFAGEHPGVVQRMVLSDTAPDIPRDGALRARSIVGSTGDIRGFKDEAAALEHFEQMHPEWQPIFRELHVRYQLRRNWANKLVFKADPDLFWYSAGSIGAKDVPYLWDMCTRIDAPTLLLAGRDSPFIDTEIADRVVETMPNATVEWTDTGHYIPREAPDLFLAAVQQFLTTSAQKEHSA